MKKFLIVTSFSVLLFQCSPGVLEGEELSQEEISYIKDLRLLDEDEEIITFSSSLRIRISGNFYTDRRIASYWQYDKTPDDNYIKSAKYNEIKSVEVKYGDDLEFSPALIVNLKDNTSFEVYFDCDKNQIDKIHKEVKGFL